MDMVISMTDRSLSSLYRRLNAQPSGRADGMLDADTLVAAAAGSLTGDRRDEVASRLSRSDVQTDLVRILRDLAPAAESVAQVVNERKISAHTRNGRTTRHAVGAARHRPTALRWTGLAACLAVALGIASWHQHGVRTEEAAIAAALEAASRPDRIFTSNDRIFSMKMDSMHQDHGDRVFNSNFNGS